jgi:hypothetical protein
MCDAGFTVDDRIQHRTKGVNTMATTTVRRRTQRTSKFADTLDAMIVRIKSDVQNFALHMSAVARDTVRLAPLVAAAFKRFQEENSGATKLDFIRLFAKPDQLANWPATDLEAKTPGSPTQALFNSVEYLMRRAGQINRQHQAEIQRQQVIAQATDEGTRLAKEQGLKGEAAATFVETHKMNALAEIGTGRAISASTDEIADIIAEGWNSDLDDYEVYEKLMARLLSLKYAARTVDTILDRAQERIVAEQASTTTETEAPNPELPTEAVPPVPTQLPAAATARPTIPFRRHRATA